jgi:PKD domain-containing protein
MNPTRFATVALLSFLLAAVPASAAPTWRTAQAISSPNSSNLTPDVAVNARGDSAAVWLSKPASVEVATRAAGGDWGAVGTLPTAVGATPGVAIDGSGHANVLWTSSTGSVDHLWTAESGSGGLSAALQLDKASPGGYAAIAVNEQGDAVAAWVGYSAAGATLRAFVRPAGGAWSGPKQISATGDFPEHVDVAIDSQGRAVVVWRSGIGSIDASFYTPGSGWGKAETIAQGDQNFGGEAPQVAIDDTGRATVVWTWGGLALPFSMVKAAEGSASSSWTPGVTLQTKGLSAGEPDVAVEPGGQAIAAWTRNDGSHTVIDAALRPAPGAAWSAPLVVSDPTKDSGTPSPAIDPHGDALVAWDQQAVVGHLAYASEWRAGGAAWGKQHALAAPASGESTPRVAFDSGGDAVAAFARGVSIQTADYDAPPALSAVQVPASGAPGETLAFSASAADLWSPATIAWDFGDGATATGSPASHAFASPGDYAVKVTARDAAGNETSETHVVHVSAPPASPPPQNHAFSGLAIKRQRIVVRHGVGRVTATCPVGTAGACAGKLRLLSGKKLLATARFSVKPGRTSRIRIRLRRVPRSSQARATAHDGFGVTRVTGAKLKLVRK